MELNRDEYIKLLLSTLNTPNIKILTGLRRVGKSTVLSQFINYLINHKQISRDKIIILDFNNKELCEQFDWKKIISYTKQKIISNDKYYLFIDEVQEIHDFGKSLLTLFENKTINIDIYITGSNSKLLSNELSSAFSGRHRDIFVLPIRFKEFITLFDTKVNNVKDLFDKYLLFGGMGKIIPFIHNDREIMIELKTIFDDCINRDIKKRYIIKKKNLFNSIVDYVFNIIGNKFSLQNIVNYILSNTKQKHSINTIYEYLNYLKNANLIREVNFYNIRGKKVLNSAFKIYSGDIGLFSYKNNFSNLNKGWRLENIVYLELLNRYDNVYTYSERGRQIDFICFKKGIATYYQVTTNLLEKNEINSNWEREVGNLELIRDSNKKIVLTLNFKNTTLSNGIKIINIIDWLLERTDKEY